LTFLERFGGDDDEKDEKFIKMIRARDDAAITTYLEAKANPSGLLLVAGLLFVSHETPYSHTISPATLDLVKKYTMPSALIGTVMSFWRDRPSTGTVLLMKYVDMRVISLTDVFTWLLQQDSWMRKSWGWEILQICSEKADGRISRGSVPPGDAPTETDHTETNPAKSDTENNSAEADPAENSAELNAEDAMPIDDQNGEANGHDINKERREVFETIVKGVGPCFERQNEKDGYWLKEWFSMVVRKYGADIAGMEATGWVGEVLAAGKEYRTR
jgi:MIF4G like